MINKIKTHIKNYGLYETIKLIFRKINKKIKLVFEKNKDYNSLNTDGAFPKNGTKVFMFANVPYYDIGGGQRSSQLAKTFNNMGMDVNYIYAFKSYETKKFNIEMPISVHLNINNYDINKFSSIVSKDDICFFESPCKLFDKYIDVAIANKTHIIYENIDNWETELGKSILDYETLKKLLKHSELLIGTANPLVNQIKDYLKKYKLNNNNILYSANAVNADLFNPLKKYEQPKDLVNGTKTFLYYGSLWGNWFDWDIIFALAKNNKDYSINLIGDYSNIINIVNSSPKNIHYLGLKKQSELPAYLSYIDYAILPFKKGLIGDYVSPLKMFEYIAVNKLVLSTSLPDIKNYPNVYYGDDYNSWNKIIKENKTVDTLKAEDFTINNTWYSRINDMYSSLKLNDKSIFKDKLSIIVLNHNNKGIINKCIDNLIRFNKKYNYEIVVVDNDSTDGSYEELKKIYKKKINLIKNEKNGCAIGRNIGVENSSRDYILFLDSDQWPTNYYWLDAYEKVITENKDFGLIGWAAGWFDSNGYTYYTVDNFPNRFLNPNCLYTNKIGYLGSGGMLITKKLFNKVKGFDVNYDPTCYEDTDLSLKVRNENKEIYYCKYLGVYHLPHQTTNEGSESHLKLLNKNKKYFVNKWQEKNPELLKYKK